MRHENFLARKTERGILVRAALTICDQRVEAAEEGEPASFPESADTRRAQSPSDDFSGAGAHPFNCGGSRDVARVRFHDQSIGIVFLQPMDQPKLEAQIKRAAKYMNVFS